MRDLQFEEMNEFPTGQVWGNSTPRHCQEDTDDEEEDFGDTDDEDEDDDDEEEEDGDDKDGFE